MDDSVLAMKYLVKVMFSHLHQTGGSGIPPRPMEPKREEPEVVDYEEIEPLQLSGEIEGE